MRNRIDHRERRVLVVEDDPGIARLLEYCLRAEGFSVELIDTGGEAMERLSAPPPTLLLLDMVLPHHDGLAILRRIRETPEWEGVPVILLTGVATEQDRVAGFEAGADDYVVKPFQLDSLLARVEVLLKNRVTAGP